MIQMQKKKKLTRQQFRYNLPQSLIAQYPLLQRDKARLMVVCRQKGTIVHDVFSNLADYLAPQSLIVLNETKVVPVRLLGRREFSGGRAEVFLLDKLSDGYSYRVLLRPLRRIKIDEKIFFNGGTIYAQLKDFKNRIVRFNKKHVERYLEKIGHVPLPPYIKRADEKLDKTYYQTVYAKKAGSVASPTAGLHFTWALLHALKCKGHKVEKITLHVNDATFRPVEEEDIRKHRMHHEEYAVSPKTLRAVIKAKEQGRKILAVGTTSCRTLETVALGKPLAGSTDLFIYPGYVFQWVDMLLTNFHLPMSTLLMLVSAFAGHDLIMKAYHEAIKRQYRFFSYGDAMLIV